MQVRRAISLVFGVLQWLLFLIGAFLLGGYLVKLLHFMLTRDGGPIAGYIFRSHVSPLIEWPSGVNIVCTHDLCVF